jgi:3-isopropylmalate/(R)-2-methylmalate dehydratase small subunit
MKAFRRVTATVAIVDRVDVDTDQIIPKQFLKRIERTGYGQFLFFDWMKDPDFELRRPECIDAEILIAGRNFGCGSSREHAAWALQDYGFSVVIAPSFGDIFRTNALKIGLLPVQLPAEDVRALAERCAGGDPHAVDLEAQQVIDPDGRTIPFEIDPFARDCLLEAGIGPGSFDCQLDASSAGPLGQPGLQFGVPGIECGVNAYATRSLQLGIDDVHRADRTRTEHSCPLRHQQADCAGSDHDNALASFDTPPAPQRVQRDRSYLYEGPRLASQFGR